MDQDQSSTMVMMMMMTMMTTMTTMMKRIHVTSCRPSRTFPTQTYTIYPLKHSHVNPLNNCFITQQLSILS